jgi:electron transport complex protein RnfE
MSFKSEFSKGIIKENPTFRMLLGMCPTLATSLAISNGIGMGLAATFVLVGSNVIISALRKVTPEKIRIPIFVVVIATFVTTEDKCPRLGTALDLFSVLPSPPVAPKPQ